MPLSLILSNSLLFLILIGVSLKDIKDGIIPNVFLFILGVLGFLRFEGTHLLSFFVLGGGAYSLYWIFLHLRGYEGFGLGDVKMMAVSGLWLDPLQIPLYLILGGGIGLGIGLLWRVFKKESRFPLGPALALALGICIVGGSKGF